MMEFSINIVLKLSNAKALFQSQVKRRSYYRKIFREHCSETSLQDPKDVFILFGKPIQESREISSRYSFLSFTTISLVFFIF